MKKLRICDRIKIILTYVTFELVHYGHIRLFKRSEESGDYLAVSVSIAEFNDIKGKKNYYDYELRKKA